MKNYIEKLAEKARTWVKIEATGSGDTDNAMRRIADRANVPYQLMWKLRFKPPKSIAWDIVERFNEAYRRECLQAAIALSAEAGGLLANPGEALNETDRTFLLAARRAGDQAQAGNHPMRRATDRTLVAA